MIIGDTFTTIWIFRIATLPFALVLSVSLALIAKKFKSKLFVLASLVPGLCLAMVALFPHTDKAALNTKVHLFFAWTLMFSLLALFALYAVLSKYHSWYFSPFVLVSVLCILALLVGFFRPYIYWFESFYMTSFFYEVDRWLNRF